MVSKIQFLWFYIFFNYFQINLTISKYLELYENLDTDKKSYITKDIISKTERLDFALKLEHFKKICLDWFYLVLFFSKTRVDDIENRIKMLQSLI